MTSHSKPYCVPEEGSSTLSKRRVYYEHWRNMKKIMWWGTRTETKRGCHYAQSSCFAILDQDRACDSTTSGLNLPPTSSTRSACLESFRDPPCTPAEELLIMPGETSKKGREAIRKNWDGKCPRVSPYSLQTPSVPSIIQEEITSWRELCRWTRKGSCPQPRRWSPVVSMVERHGQRRGGKLVCPTKYGQIWWTQLRAWW